MDKTATRGRQVSRASTLAIAVALLLQGCTTHMVSTGDSGNLPYTEGAPYRLPIRTFAVDMTWQVKCSMDDDPLTGLKRLNLSFEQIGAASSSLLEGEALVIDYRKMTNPFKTGMLDLKYWTIGEGKEARPTLLVKSINSEITGQEAEAIKAGVGALGSIANIALSASGIPLKVGGLGTVAVPLPPGCDTDVSSATEKLAASDATLKKIAKDIEKKTLRITLISGRVVGGKLTQPDEAELTELTQAVDALADQADTETKTVKKLKQMLSYKQSFPISEFDWPAGTGSPVSDLSRKLEPKAGELAKLASKAVAIDESWCAESDTNKAKCDEVRQLVQTGFGNWDAVVRLTATGPGISEFTPAFSRMTRAQLEAQSFNGFVFREPVHAKLTVESGSGKSISELAVTMPQYGRVRVLPLRSRFAEKNGLTADFAQDGLPTAIKYQAYEAGGVKALQATQAVFDEAGRVVGLLAADSKAKNAKAEGADLQAVKDRIALLTEQQKLAVLEKTPDPDVSAREAELQQLRFEVERQDLLKKLGRGTMP